jgi:uracil-DNA glycosylase
MCEPWEKLEHDVTSCRRCPRLVTWREEVARTKRRAYQAWSYWGKPVPGFGDRDARLLVLGLAPGAHGSNRTGRMFTGDGSGETLYGSLFRTGFANQSTWERPDDGLALHDAFVTAVGRCAPPENRPTREELDNCMPFLVREVELLSNLQVVLALGKVAFDGYLRLLETQGHEIPRPVFGHGLDLALPAPLPRLMAAYHPSRQNTQTGRLTLAMLDSVFEQARAHLSTG